MSNSCINNQLGDPTMQGFQSFDETSAPEPARSILRASRTRFGFLPSPIARIAASPTVLKHSLAAFAAFEATSLSALEREVVAMTVAFERRCHYCMAMHSKLTAAEHPREVAALRDGTPLADERLEALRALTRELASRGGDVSKPTTDRARAAGFRNEQLLEVALGVATYILSTSLNVLTEAPLDDAFAGQAWPAP
jgi:uncharacterized peroxidase-related enzyme